MDDNKELVTNLILAVCQLCDETRELAQLETEDERSLARVQDAAHLVTLAIGRVRENWSAAALPVEGLADATAKNWLLGDD